MFKPIGALLLFTFFILSTVYGQKTENVSTDERKNTFILISSGTVIYTGTMIGLNELWYKDYPKSSFHLFNDSQQWLNMDKAGHFMTSYFLGSIGKESFEAMGAKPKVARYVGGSLGFMFLTGLEFLDGFSSEWGFSLADQGMNALGTGVYIGQELLWEEQRIQFKYSYSHSSYAKYNPNLLGRNTAERMLKDYNGQTYWASINIYSFLNRETSNFPKWLNLALGYGGDGMLGGRNNNSFDDLNITRQRQYYFSLDIDLSRIETKSKMLNALKRSFGFLKFPAPTFEINSKGNNQFYFLYY